MSQDLSRSGSGFYWERAQACYHLAEAADDDEDAKRLKQLGREFEDLARVLEVGALNAG